MNDFFVYFAPASVTVFILFRIAQTTSLCN